MKLFHLTVCLIFVLGSLCFAQSNYAVLMQESPAGAGEITPGSGVHTFNVNQTVTLNTVPKAGWHFVHWLGDVSNPTTNRTMLSVDGPKIVIAVFQRDEYELPFPDLAMSSNGQQSLIPRHDETGGGLGGGMIRGHSHGGGGGGGDEGDPPPVPDVPEPATVLLLTIGAGLGLINRKKMILIK